MLSMFCSRTVSAILNLGPGKALSRALIDILYTIVYQQYTILFEVKPPERLDYLRDLLALYYTLYLHYTL